MAEPEATASADLWVGLFESEIARYVREFCRPGQASVDVGANSGYYALTFARLCAATVVAYEPDAAARERLGRNLALNPSLEPYIDLRPLYVSDHDAADTVRLDGDLKGVSRIGLLKIDVDGGEVGVLRGARDLLRQTHPHVIIETHSLGLEQECAQLLAEAGYAPRVLTQRRFLPQDRPIEHNRWLVARRA